MPNLFRHLIEEDAPFDTPIGGSGSAALMNIRYQSRCLSSPAEILKSALA
jgi:hypothetical protein